MKRYLIEKWFAPEAQDRMQVVSYGSELAMVEIQGEGVFRQGSIGNEHLVDLLILEGELTFTANGRQVTLAAPAYVDFIGSNIWSWKDLITSPDFNGRLFAMTQPFFRMIIEPLTVKMGDKIFDYLQNPFWSLSPDDARRLCRLLEILFDTMENTRHIALRDFLQNILRSYMSDLMNIIFRQRNLSGANGTQNGVDTIVQFLHLLYNHYLEHHEVKWYAEQLSVSPNALSVALKKAYGQSANMFIDNMLFEKAKVYLSHGEYSIQQVADMLNFSDQSAFGKFFKRCSGLSPSTYLRQSMHGRSSKSAL